MPAQKEKFTLDEHNDFFTRVKFYVSRLDL